jgi:hypothetical protein
VGSTRNGLLSTTYAATLHTVDAAPSAFGHAASTAASSPTSGDSAPHSLIARSSRTDRLRAESNVSLQRAVISVDASPSMREDRARNDAPLTNEGAARSMFALLRPYEGRHDLDEPTRHGTRGQARRSLYARAVKNLRFVRLAVLLLNFREVRDFHFCSISVAT